MIKKPNIHEFAYLTLLDLMMHKEADIRMEAAQFVVTHSADIQITPERLEALLTQVSEERPASTRKPGVIRVGDVVRLTTGVNRREWDADASNAPLHCLVAGLVGTVRSFLEPSMFVVAIVFGATSPCVFEFLLADDEFEFMSRAPKPKDTVPVSQQDAVQLSA